MELTKEFFEQALKSLATKTDLQDGLADSEQRIVKSVIKRIDEAQEELARMTSAGFDDLQSRLDVAERMKAFERKFQRLEEALHIKL